MSEIKRYKVTEPYLDIDCELGEGPFYDESAHALRFVDVVKQQIHKIDLHAGPSSHSKLDFDISIGVIRQIEGNDEEFVFGGKHGYGVLNKETGKYRYIKRVWTEEEVRDNKEHRMRGNDGTVDTQGRFWLGFMNDPLVLEPGPEGALFRLDNDLSLHRVLTNVTIPNGACFSSDDTKMYWADSPSKSIFVFDYDVATGNISNRQVFWKSEEEGCVPDGHCLDAEGYMWTAVHGAGKVLRISPEGQLVAEIDFPTRCITCPAFVGEDLFVTSMADEEEKELEKFPQGKRYMGRLFKVHVGVKGAKMNKFKPSVAI